MKFLDTYAAVAFLSQCNAEWDAVCVYGHWHWGVWLSNGGVEEFRWLLSSFLSSAGEGHHSYRQKERERVMVLVQAEKRECVNVCVWGRESRSKTENREIILRGTKPMEGEWEIRSTERRSESVCGLKQEHPLFHSNHGLQPTFCHPQSSHFTVQF